MPVLSPVITTLTAVGQSITPTPPFRTSGNNQWEVRIDNLTSFVLKITMSGVEYWHQPLTSAIYRAKGPTELTIQTVASIGTVNTPQIFIMWATYPDAVPIGSQLTAGVTSSTPTGGSLEYAYVETRTAQAGIGTGITDLTGLVTSSLTFDGVTPIIIDGVIPYFIKNVSAGWVQCAIYEGGTELTTNIAYTAIGNNCNPRPQVRLIPTAGAHVYKLRASAQADTCDMFAFPTEPAYIRVTGA